MTIQTLIEKHKEFNEKIFGGKLKTIKIEFLPISGSFGKYFYNGKIQISSTVKRTDNEFFSTLIHEMIHQFLNENGYYPREKPHGYTFKLLAHRINVNYPEYNISVSSKTNINICEYSGEKSIKTHNVCVVKFLDTNEQYIYVFDPKQENILTNLMFFNKPVEMVHTQCFLSTDKYFDTFRKCRRNISGRLINDDELSMLNLTKYRDSKTGIVSL